MDKKRILIVDDESINQMIVGAYLKDTYELLTASSGEEALELAQSNRPPDLILLDVMMPGIGGYETCKLINQDKKTKGIPIIFLTGLSDEDAEVKGFSLGAVDYVTKPISPSILTMRIKTHLALKRTQSLLKATNTILERKVEKATEELKKTQEMTIFALSSLVEARDHETGGHILRTQGYVQVLAETLAFKDKYKKILTRQVIYSMAKSAPLHDIGKVGVPDAILFKPGPLTDEEFEVMKKHTTYGYNALKKAKLQFGDTSLFLTTAIEIVYGHHEKWDGTGYPRGLKEEEIPLSSRIMALSDVYDALRSARHYKVPFSREKAIEIIKNGRGTNFDPEVVDAFLESEEKFEALNNKYSN